MPIWKRKSQVVTPVVMDRESDRADAFAALSNMVATANDNEVKSFDWNHYQAMIGGGNNNMFGGEFDVLPTARVMKGLYLQEPWVNACVSVMSRQFLSPRFQLASRKADGDKKIITKHKFLEAMRRPAGDESPAHFTTNGVSDLCLTGNAYWYDDESLKERRRIPSEKIEPVVENNRIVRYRIMDKGGFSKADLPAELVTHIRLPNPFTPHSGLPVFIAVLLPILIEKFGREYVVGFFLRGGHTAGIVETDTTNADQLLRLARTIMQAIGGRRNMHADKILPKGAIWKSAGSSFSEMKLVEMLKDNAGHFRAATGCTNTVLGLVENVNRATAWAEMELFWKCTILPLQRLWCEGIMASPLWDRYGMREDWELQFDNSEVEYLDDFDRRLDQDAKLAAVATVNERRERLGMEKLTRLGDKIASELGAQVPHVVGDTSEGGEPKEGDATPGEVEAAANAVTTPQVSLTGIQITALMEVLARIASKQIPRETGVALIATAFALSREAADALVGPVGTSFFVDPPAPPPPFGGGGGDQDDDEDPPPDPPKGGKDKEKNGPKPDAHGADALVRWKAAELELQEPDDAVRAVFRREFSHWQDIVLANIEDESAGREQIAGRSVAFAQNLAFAALPACMRAYEHQLENVTTKHFSGAVLKEAETNRRAKLTALKERARQVVQDRIFSNGKDTFLGYSRTAMDSIYGFIADELNQGRSMTDVAAQIRLRFAESYEAYEGQAETIVRTEFGAAISIAQEKFGDDLATVAKTMEKHWVAMGDNFVRDSHAEAEAESPITGPSEEVMAEPFGNGLRFPRESGAPPEECINCRCTQRFEVVEWSDE